MGSEASILWSLLFGAVGLGYFMYGRKLQKTVPLVCGLGLMLFPYFVTDTSWVIATGGVLSSVPWLVRS